MRAVNIHCTTMVGIGGPLPTKGGNCFSVETDTREYRYISNMRLENFEGLMKLGALAFPVEIEDVTPRSSKVVDPRVPEDWLTDKICGVCYR